MSVTNGTMSTSAPTSRPVTSVPTAFPTPNVTQISYVCELVDEGGSNSFDQSSWIIAVSLAVFAAFSNNLGVNLQKLAWTKKQNTPTTYWYRFYWVGGMVCIVLASVFDFVALAFAPQSVIAPMGSLTMVSNTCVAPWMHGEKLHGSVVLATLIIVVGCIIAVASASHVNEICSVDALFALYITGRFAVYCTIFFSMVFAVMWFIRRAEKIKKDWGEDAEEYRRVFRYHRVSYAFLSGLFGAQSVLFARSVGQLTVGSTRGDRLFLAYPGTYVIVFCLVGCILLQLYFLNLGLARFESMYNVPVFTGTFIVGVALGGGVFYGEFSQFSPWQAVLFPLGVGMCIAGVFMLSRGTPADHASPGGAGVAPADNESEMAEGRRSGDDAGEGNGSHAGTRRVSDADDEEMAGMERATWTSLKKRGSMDGALDDDEAKPIRFSATTPASAAKAPAKTPAKPRTSGTANTMEII